MSPEDTSAEVETQAGQETESTTEASQRTDFNTLPADVQTRIRELQDEAKKYRKQKADAEKQRQQEETARLEAGKEFEKLASTYKGELDTLKPRAERLDAMEQFLTESAQKRISALPKQYQSLVPDYDDPLKTLAWLDANAQLFARPPVPGNTGAGETGDLGKRAVELTDEQKAIAKRLRIPEDKYAAQLRKEQAKRS